MREKFTAFWNAPFHGDISKFKNLVWLGSVGLVASGAIAWVVSLLMGSDVWAKRVLLTASSVLFLVSIGLLYWIHHLHNQRTDLVRKHDDATELLAKANYRNKESARLISACRDVDKQMMVLCRHNASVEKDRHSVLLAVLVGCCQNIISDADVEFDDKRLAFLTYGSERDRFIVMAGLHLGQESHTHVETKLSKDKGLAGKAMMHVERQLIYVPDVMAPEARKAGYIATRDVDPIGSICCKGVWVNDTFMGVLSVDCPKVNAFTEDDRRVIEIFIGKLELVFAMFPPDSEAVA